MVEEVARGKEGAVKGGHGDKCRAEDPNNCRFHHTGRFAQCKASLSPSKGVGEIPPPFDKGRAQSLLKYAFTKPMELVKYAPPELADFELKEDARKLPVAKAIAAVLPYADAFGKRLNSISEEVVAARNKVYATKWDVQKDIIRLTAQLDNAKDEAEKAKIRSAIRKNSSIVESLYENSRDLESRTYAKAFSTGTFGTVKIDCKDEAIDPISLTTLRQTVPYLFSDSVLPEKAAVIVGTSVKRSTTDADGIRYARYEDAETLVHEYAHFVEYNNEHLHARCVEFLEHRCADEKSAPLSELGDGVFAAEETARKDRFFHAYCGKDYIDENGERVSTEILSMGVEMMLIDPVMFYERDREYFAFVVGAMKGLI